VEIATIDLDGPVHYADHGGEGSPMLLVHGLGGAFINWMAVAPALAERHRVLAVDLVGFGSTEPLGRSASVEANRDLVHRFVEEMFGGPAIIVGNSMGGLISMMVAATHPETASALVLVDPAAPPPTDGTMDPVVEQMFTAYAMPGVGEELLKSFAALGPEVLVEQLLALTCADPAKLDPDVVAAHLEYARDRFSAEWADVPFLEGARTMLAVLLDPEAYHAVVRTVRAPTLLIEGELDRLVKLSAAEEIARRRPDWTFEVLPGIGHVPMMEDPDGFVRLVEGWLDERGLSSAPHQEGAAAR
jgi:pimeloyl-ACP methyl ester carboxylesterase